MTTLNTTTTSPNIVMVVSKQHGMYPLHVHWLDIPASIARWKAAGAFTEPAFKPSVLRTNALPTVETVTAEDDPYCMCGVAWSEHGLCGCNEWQNSENAS